MSLPIHSFRYILFTHSAMSLILEGRMGHDYYCILIILYYIYLTEEFVKITVVFSRYCMLTHC